MRNSIVAIAHQTAPNSNGKFQRENGIRFPILHDEGDVAVAFGIRWSPQGLALMEAQLGKLAGLNTEISWMLPMQARYVIGADGMIAYTDIDADYRYQPEPAEILPEQNDEKLSSPQPVTPSRLFVTPPSQSGTEISNPVPSSGESAANAIGPTG